MLQLFYRWLVWNSSSCLDINHRCWKLLDLYLKTKPTDPFSLSDMYDQIHNLDSEAAGIIRNRLEKFTSQPWKMVIEDGGLVFRDDYDDIKDDDIVMLVSFSLTEPRVVTYL